MFTVDGVRDQSEFRVHEMSDLPDATWSIAAAPNANPAKTDVTVTRSAAVANGPCLFLVSADGRLLTSP